MKTLGLPPSDFLSKYLRVARLYEEVTDIEIPCKINNITITNEYTVPNEPVDSNVEVNARVIRKPLTISLELFVYDDHWVDYKTKLSEIGSRDNNLVLIDRCNEKYDNLVVVSYSFTQANDVQGGFSGTLELQQITKVEAIKSTIKLKTLSPDKQPMLNQGNEIASGSKDKGKSIAAAIVDSVGGTDELLKTIGKEAITFTGF